MIDTDLLYHHLRYNIFPRADKFLYQCENLISEAKEFRETGEDIFEEWCERVSPFSNISHGEILESLKLWDFLEV